uniref:Cyclic nucleotide-binding domain-containing protein n=1 Tax=Meloidogyne javanica TaxID=6303 RepID=A0A915N4L5_MELJA
MYTQREQQYQRLLDRIHSLNNLKSLPDQLFGYLLAKSDPVPISVPKGVILFRQGECVQGWYLLLSGEVQLYIEQTTSQSQNKFIEQQIKIIGPGILFGALQTCHKHSCSAKILKNAEFVRIPQNNFLLIYNKWADRLQSCIVLMEDLNNNNIQNPPKTNSLIFLANSGRDSLLQTILKKPKDYRTEEELKLILEEINYIRGFSYLKIVEYAGTIIFKKGDLANCWYTVLNGSLEAKSEGKKSIIREGDDFGKLSILNNEYKNGNQQKNNLRQTTVLTSQNDCQLLKINSFDFKQIISEIESKTIRLKQEIQDFNEDFLILQKDSENL